MQRTILISCNNAKTHNIGGDLGDQARDGLPGPPVVGHLELDGVADLEVLDVAVELGEVEEQARLAVAALDEAVGVLRKG